MFAGVEFGKRYPLRFVPCSEESNLVSLDYQFKPVINLDPSQRSNVVTVSIRLLCWLGEFVALASLPQCSIAALPRCTLPHCLTALLTP
jgi:hypothetical protein